MDENLPNRKDKNSANSGDVFNKWIKPLAVITAVFLIGFSVPVFIKNYVGKKAGVTPTKQPAEAEVKTPAAPYYMFKPGNLILRPGETAEIKVYLNTNKITFEAFDFVASYNPSIVEVTSVNTTPLFPSYPGLEYGNGKIIIGGNIGVDKSFSTNDLLAIITVEGKSAGETSLSLDKSQSTIASKGENILNEANSVNISVQ